MAQKKGRSTIIWNGGFISIEAVIDTPTEVTAAASVSSEYQMVNCQLLSLLVALALPRLPITDYRLRKLIVTTGN